MSNPIVLSVFALLACLGLIRLFGPFCGWVMFLVCLYFWWTS